MTTIKPTSIPTKRLAASINASSMSFVLNNIEGWDGVDLTSSDLGTKAYGVFRNSQNTIMELFEYDPSTIASASITILRRGLKFTGDTTTEVTANKLTWIRNETLCELGSDSPQFLQYFTDAIIAGGVDSSTTYKGITKLSVAPAVAGNPIAAGDNDPRLPTAAQVGYIPTSDQKNALAGTEGTPSSSNKFQTATGVQKQTPVYGASSVGTDSYAITVTPAVSAYVAGMRFTFKADVANTGACTLAVGTGAAKAIKKYISSDLETGDILANQIVSVEYDAINDTWQIVSLLGQIPSVTKFNYVNTSPTGGSGGSETTTFSTTLPGGLLGTAGILIFECPITLATGSQYTFKLTYGTTATTLTIASGTGTGSIKGRIFLTLVGAGATNSQKAVVQISGMLAGNNTTVQNYNDYTSGTCAEDSTADKTISLKIGNANGGVAWSVDLVTGNLIRQ